MNSTMNFARNCYIPRERGTTLRYWYRKTIFRQSRFARRYLRMIHNRGLVRG